MTLESTRYVSIDCEITGTGRFKISLQLNQTTLSGKNMEMTPLKEELFNNNEAVIEYESDDVTGFLNDLFEMEFPGYSDITYVKPGDNITREPNAVLKRHARGRIRA